MGRDDRDSRDREYRKNRRRYDDDDHDDDDDYKRSKYRHKPNTVERILTPGRTTNNFIKMGATGIIAGATLLLMIVYGIAGDRLAGASWLPLVTTVASAISTACVWIFARHKSEDMHEAQVRSLKNQIADLNLTVEEMQAHFDIIDRRLTDAEYIEDFEERLARKEITSRQLSSDIPISNSPISTPASTNMPGSGGHKTTTE